MFSSSCSKFTKEYISFWIVQLIRERCLKQLNHSQFFFLLQYDDPNATISGILDEVRKYVSTNLDWFFWWILFLLYVEPLYKRLLKFLQKITFWFNTCALFSQESSWIILIWKSVICLTSQFSKIVITRSWVSSKWSWLS